MAENQESNVSTTPSSESAPKSNNKGKFIFAIVLIGLAVFMYASLFFKVFHFGA
ncbi:MAG: hypothetical protein HQL54_01000 [Magnetococcales bacterium]|nr:hypothetical protein [Magnetococcales bacterium]